MRKIIFIFGLYILVSGCSVLKKESGQEKRPATLSQGKFKLSGLEEQNITGSNFFIQKAEIELDSDGENQKFLASIKFVCPDKYLVSLRSRSGIEAARIYITADTILVNDRINKSLYYGKPQVLARRYGISFDLLPVFFGDFIKGNDLSDKEIVCSGGNAVINCVVKGIPIEYTVDCDSRKVISAHKEGSMNSSYAELEYGNFISKGTGLLPSVISLNFNKTVIGIKIIKVDSPWEGSIEFVPGNRYKLIELL